MEFDQASMIRAIAEVKEYTPTVWEKRFLRKMRIDAKNGIPPNTKEGKKLHEIYRKSMGIMHV